jgi:hypothetical protein
MLTFIMLTSSDTTKEIWETVATHGHLSSTSQNALFQHLILSFFLHKLRNNSVFHETTL